jgi:hypothetical protein
MFLLNNIYDRPYDKLYPKIPRVVFDISKSQLGNVKNADWGKIGPDSIVCVVNSSRKISTFWRIDRNFEAELDGETELQHVITGMVVAKAPDPDMTPLLNKFKVSSRYLPKNQFSIGFNVADLGSALDDLEVTVRDGQVARKIKLGSL